MSSESTQNRQVGGTPVGVLAQVHQTLAKRIADPKVKFVPGLAEDLRCILAGFDELERRTAQLAAMFLRKHYWPASQLHDAQLESLMEFGAEPATVGRVAKRTSEGQK